MKLIAFDLDGTTLRKHKEISERNTNALNRAAERGIILVPATGRIRSFIPQDVLQLNTIRYLITSNGANIYDRKAKKTVYKNEIPTEKAVSILNYLQKFKIYIELYCNGFVYSQEKDPKTVQRKYEIKKEEAFFLNKKFCYTDSLTEFLIRTSCKPEKINLPYLSSEIRKEIWCKLKQQGGMKLTSSIPNNLEINEESTNKGSALVWLADYLKIAKEAVMAIGDNGNDVDMLRFAGTSVAMENGTTEAINAAKFQTASCEADGLAIAIDRYALQYLQ